MQNDQLIAAILLTPKDSIQGMIRACKRADECCSCFELTGEVVQMNRKGFTLIELLIVVVIIGILAAIAIPKFAITKAHAYLAATRWDLRQLFTSEKEYFADCVTYT